VKYISFERRYRGEFGSRIKVVKKKKVGKLKLSKETKEERKKRVSSGIHFRTAVFDDKRRKKQERQLKDELRSRENESL